MSPSVICLEKKRGACRMNGKITPVWLTIRLKPDSFSVRCTMSQALPITWRKRRRRVVPSTFSPR
ncbi:hypothetical protein D3C85_1178200 [compost metagenome]